MSMEDIVANKTCPPASYQDFLLYLEKQFCDENLEFVTECTHFITVAGEAKTSFEESQADQCEILVEFMFVATSMVDRYIRTDCDKEVNISSQQKAVCLASFEKCKTALEEMRKEENPTSAASAADLMDQIHNLFKEPSREIASMMAPVFRKFHMELSVNIPPSQKPIRIAISIFLLLVCTGFAVWMGFSVPSRYARISLLLPSAVSFSFFFSGQARI